MSLHPEYCEKYYYEYKKLCETTRNYLDSEKKRWLKGDRLLLQIHKALVSDPKYEIQI